MIILLLIVLGACWYSAVQGKKQYRAFTEQRSAHGRLYFYRRWLIESWLLFGGLAVLSLSILGKSQYLFNPIVQTSLMSALPQSIRQDPSAVSGFLSGLAFGFVVLAVIVKRARHGKSIPLIGDYAALLPRTSQERRYGAALAVSAGFNEELFFRAALPVLVYGVFHSFIFAVIVSTLFFAAGHYYQGWKGVFATAIGGLFLTKLFLLSGTILVPIAVHAFINLNSMLIVPILSARARRMTH